MRKAIFIDGPSFSNILKAIGIYNWDFAYFLEILTKEVGEARELVNKPVFVLPERFLVPIRKALQAVGYETVAVDSEDGKDDEFIKREIRNLPIGSVDEIVLVSADLDYLNTLKDKEASGVKIFIVATAENDSRRGSPMLSDVLKNAFSFVELAQYQERLMKSPYVSKPRRGQEHEIVQSLEKNNPPQTLLVFEAKLQMTTEAAEIAKFWADMALIIKKYPGIQVFSSTSSATSASQNI
ncbi:MAG: hypothetical protein Q7S54_01440 [bacterium]|nr:hypothetical protein [bacterium]